MWWNAVERADGWTGRKDDGALTSVRHFFTPSCEERFCRGYVVHRVHGWTGRKDRNKVALDAVVHRLDGSHAPVKLTNMSDEGCRIECSDHLQIGERLAIAIPRLGQLNAQVRWALQGSAGARFLDDSDAQK